MEVCDRAPVDKTKSSRSARVICKCNRCNNYIITTINEFRIGTTISCGCYNKDLHKDLCKEIGKKSYYKDYSKEFNPFYEFIRPTDRSASDGSVYWVVRCKKCKQEYEEIPSFLVSDKRRRGNNPCQCYQFNSKGILKIIQILEENKIEFEQEKIFNDCLSPKNVPLRFDIFIKNKKYIIEYDGEQHFRPTTFGGKISGEERLKLNKEYDNIKNKYCFENNIPLIRIPFYDYEKITIKDLIPETSKYLIQGESDE